ncbi:hypothetical protein AAVH_09057 [Aphelenchoides avenae]|nr:hypothetical protein AAVH_09057 [Aphelenchus avenae]
MADGKALAEGMTLEFLDDADLADFIPAALRNCILGNLGLIHNSCFDAMSKVAQTVVVKDTLVLFASMFKRQVNWALRNSDPMFVIPSFSAS